MTKNHPPEKSPLISTEPLFPHCPWDSPDNGQFSLLFLRCKNMWVWTWLFSYRKGWYLFILGGFNRWQLQSTNLTTPSSFSPNHFYWLSKGTNERIQIKLKWIGWASDNKGDSGAWYWVWKSDDIHVLGDVYVVPRVLLMTWWGRYPISMNKDIIRKEAAT